LRKCLIDENKLIKALAYNGFILLSIQHSKYSEKTKQFFQVAMKDEAPLVNDKIMNIMKKDFQ
jgi:hypothetical protein